MKNDRTAPADPERAAPQESDRSGPQDTPSAAASPPEPPEAGPEGKEPEDEIVEGELLTPDDELPVMVQARVVGRPARTPAVVAQTAVAAATGFVAGAATLALLKRYGGRLAREADPFGERLELPRRGSRGATTSYVIQVRAIARRID